jgi:GT2 family glycosyltransferase
MSEGTQSIQSSAVGAPGSAVIKSLVPAPDRPWRVAAVCPCFNRPQDLEILLTDFAKLDIPGITLWVTIVDNASTKPLSTLKRPEGLNVEFVRSEKNTGGSGGFNLGMSHILSGSGLSGEMGEPDFVWWVDSDARVGRRSLRALVNVMKRYPKVGAVGAAMGEIATAQIWEAGGRIFKERGTFGVAAAGDIDRRAIVKCHYVAACCALIRTDAIRKTGLFPENFIYYDDIDWCVQMTRKTGYVCRATRKARAFHPPGNRRFATWGRYYIARNGFSVMEMKKLGGMARFRRAMFEVPRAIAQTMMGINELAELHLRGLNDAADGNFPAIEPKDILKPIGMKPYTGFVDAVKEELGKFGPNATLFIHPFLRHKLPFFETFHKELRKIDYTWSKADWKIWRNRQQGGHMLSDAMGAMWRALTGPSADVAIVPTGWPTNWFRGKVLIQVTADGYLVRSVKPWPTIFKAMGVYSRGVKVALRLAMKSPGIRPLPAAPAWNPKVAPVATERAEPVTA